MKKIALALAIMVIFATTGAFADQPRPWQLSFQEAASPVMEQLIHLHDDILMYLVVGVSLFVLLLLGYICVRFSAKNNPIPSKTTHHNLLEVVWTAVPVIILLLIFLNTWKILYFMDRTEDAEMTLKITGYQWYWGYEYADEGEKGLSFESYMLKEEELTPERPLRLLEVDNRIVLPINTNIRLLMTSADVIHAWAIPAFGVKLDAIPGRLNETWTRITKEGVYYGQCSELCGAYHAFMPIVVEAVSKEDYKAWLIEAKKKFADDSEAAAYNIENQETKTVTVNEKDELFAAISDKAVTQ